MINTIKSLLDLKGSPVIVEIIPIEQQLNQVDSSHQSLITILGKIKTNVEESRRFQPWKAPRWKTAKITAQHIEELGLLVRLGEIDVEGSVREMKALISELMEYYEQEDLVNEIGSYYELFLSETAIAIIYASEYFSKFLSIQEQEILKNHLFLVSNMLWELILNTSDYNTRTQSRLAWNHSQFVHAVTGICSLKLDNEYSEERLSRAILWMEGYLSHSFTWDGFSREGVFYAGATRSPLFLFLIALKKYKGVDLLKHSALINHSQYLIDEWIPKSSKFITRNDINHDVHSTTLSSLLVYAYYYQCKKALVLWEAVVGEKGDRTFGNPSSESNRNGSLVLNYLFYPTNLDSTEEAEAYINEFKVYREAGVVLGFTRQEECFKYSFQASSYYGDIHSQSDHGQIYLCLNGDILLGDTSVGNSRHPNTPGQSEGHNSLIIDGEGMSLSGQGWQTCSILEDVVSYGDYHVMRANLAPAYNAFHSRTTIANFKRLVVVHVKEPYHIIVLDSVSDYHDIAHDYAYRFHTDLSHTMSCDQKRLLVEAPNSVLEIVPLGIDWIPQTPKSFEFNGGEKSRYSDCTFTGKNYLGGYVLIPSQKNSPMSVSSNNTEVTISNECYKSSVKLNFNHAIGLEDVLNCSTSTLGQEGHIPNRMVRVQHDSSLEGASIDFLTGSIISKDP